MNIAFITPPGQGGVRDFVDKLIENMPLEHSASDFTWQKNMAKSIYEDTISQDCIYLQYSGYGYANRGAPLWLLKQLQSNRSQIKTLGICFHELYAFGPLWGSAFWLSPVQRHIARGLVELADFWITNREESAKWLRRFAGKKPHAVLPVFSNIGEIPLYSSLRAPKVVVFGGVPLRLKTYQTGGDQLFAWLRRQGLELHDIGPTRDDPDISNRLSTEGVIIHGRLPETEISQLFTDAMFGVLAYPIEYVAKSGVFASYCAHGVCPILIAKDYRASDGLIQNKQYLSGIPNNFCAPNYAADISEAAWNWYQPHKLANHAEALNNLLLEVGHV
jgi:hypothetical protein